MIERFSIATTASQLASRFEAEEPKAFHARYNIAPAQLVPLLTATDSRGFSFFYWGQPPALSKNKSVAEKIINVRREWIEEKSMLRKYLKHNRCLIPLDGFYVWKKVGKKTIIPWRFCGEGNELFSMPAFWEEYEDTEGNNIHTFMVITAEATPSIEAVTNRMPALFKRKEEMVWLSQASSEDELLNLLKKPTPVNLKGYSVSHQLNDPLFDRPSLILPTQPADQFGNLTLFD
ncbi:MAG: SOS response-associated peptidase [Bacteroidetes bacterium]|nr:SOS response-associated peptidase [Bacteroidota bacterium]